MLYLSTIISLVLLFKSTQNCQPSLQNDRLLTGTYTFVVQTQNSKLCYSLPTDLSNQIMKPSSQVQLSVGISSIQSYSNTNGLDYSLRGRLQNQNTQIKFNLLINGSLWQQVSIQYLLTVSYPQFLLGSFIGDTSSLLSCNNSITTTAVVSIPIIFSNTNINSQSNLFIITFINGLRTNSTTLNIKTGSNKIDFSLKILNTTIQSDAYSQIDLVFLAYLIVDLNVFSNIYSYVFSPALNADFSIFGLVGITNQNALMFSGIWLNKINKLTCSGLACNCTSIILCQNQGGNIIGNVCIKCLTGQIVQNGVCTNQCPSNSTFLNGACVCNQNYYNISGICQLCPSGTIYSSLFGNCTSICGLNQIWTNNQCVCQANYVLIAGYCSLCPLKTVYNSVTQSCSCGTNQVFINNTCQCASGYFLQSGICQSCPSNSIYQASNQSCIVCSTNQTVVNGSCKCLPIFVQYQGKCFTCPPNSSVTQNQTGCICNSGYYYVSLRKTCELITDNINSINCPSNSVLGNNNICICNSGYYLLNNECVSYCQNNQIWNTTINACTCSIGKILINNYCVSVTSNSNNIQVKEQAKTNNYIFQNVILNNIPSALTVNNCTLCNSILLVKVVSNITPIPNFEVNYINNTNPFQFIIVFIFSTAPTNFSFTLQINPIYAMFYTQSEIKQSITVNINPSNLTAINSSPSSTGALPINSLRITLESIESQGADQKAKALSEALSYFNK